MKRRIPLKKNALKTEITAVSAFDFSEQPVFIESLLFSKWSSELMGRSF